ncbi:sigma-70 family RNA polymerase sigma factor [Halobacillus salinarum]|uniref:Sigma-70 family RNA polymerase sigma factor n=1 Tax=Halobacillus salinarum TaxID=2932257 RepID=A0ABY4EPZ5_9BACI|nr:sigma-70 family RNA polymerase sigma factor [Halobacillus salinarum]UOQ46525.1 sigma-70 family RNA polymerase sigma factor [Halobacillus salinarum]
MSFQRKENVPDEEMDDLLDEIMDTYSRQVYLLAYSYVKDKGMAEDISQDVFIKVYRQYHHFRGDAALSSWIYRITANRSKDILRRKKLAQLKYPLKYFEKEQHTESTEKTYVKQNQKERILTAVLSLPVKYREVLILYYFHDQPIEQLSETLNEKENTIKTRLSRGREKLKSHPIIREGLI